MRNLGDDDVAHVDYEKLNSVVENFGNVHIHVDLRKHVPVVKNHNNVVHVDYEKHDPIVRNLENDKAKHEN